MQGKGTEVSDLLIQLGEGISKMASLGFYLRRDVILDDLVVCFGEVKIHNANIFEIGN